MADAACESFSARRDTEVTSMLNSSSTLIFLRASGDPSAGASCAKAELARGREMSSVSERTQSKSRDDRRPHEAPGLKWPGCASADTSEGWRERRLDIADPFREHRYARPE